MTNLKHTIARHELQAVISQSLAQAAGMGMTDRQLERIREVAATTRRVAFGDCVIEHCGCPMVKARVVRNDNPGWTPGQNEFAGAYDRLMEDMFGAKYGVVEVVG